VREYVQLCQGDGTVACTEKACGGCTEDGKPYAEGESFPKQCNTCTCGAAGVITCIEGVCCEHADAYYEAGATFDSGDGCNSCTCGSDGSVACTEAVCRCEHLGKLYAIGETYDDGCNTCTCMADLQMACTGAVCGCEYGGKAYPVGESFPAEDGCNTCTCMEGGSVGCTEIACLGCQYHGEFYPVGASWADGCLDCTCAAAGQPTCSSETCPSQCWELSECAPGLTCVVPPCDMCGTPPKGWCLPVADPPASCWFDWECGEAYVCVDVDLPKAGYGQCLPALELGSCWDEKQCPDEAVCVGASYCPQGVDCGIPQKPGTCALPDAAEAVILCLSTSYYLPGSKISPVWWNFTKETIYLYGCSSYVLEKKAEEAWTNLGPPVDCASEPVALAVPPAGVHATDETYLPVPGNGWSLTEYRIRGEYGVGCKPGEPLASAGCTSMLEAIRGFAAGPPPP
jgi:hypothetical protein